MGSNEEIRRLAQEAEKQQLFAQKVQQQNTNLTSQLEMYKERSQFVRDRDIIRDLEKLRDKLELDVKDYKRQKEEYQKTQTIFNQTQRNKEEKYLDDIIQLQAKIKDLENVVCKMGKSTDTLRLLTNEQKAFWDNLHKSGLGYNGPYVLSQAYAKIPMLYHTYELCDKNKQLHVFDSEETLEDAEKSQLKMNEFQKDEKVQEVKIQAIDYGKLNKLYDNFVPQKDLSAEQTYFPSSCISSVSKISSEELFSKTKPSMASMPILFSAVVFKGFLISAANYGGAGDCDCSCAEVWCYCLINLLSNQSHCIFSGNAIGSQSSSCVKDSVLDDDWKSMADLRLKNKDLHDKIKRISKESKDVSNESKTADTVCNDAFEVSQGLSKRIVELEKDLLKFKAKSVAFEIALQHKSQEIIL
ncbi:hypothetical protein Tco_0128340 [Tanacetum coccineum]